MFLYDSINSYFGSAYVYDSKSAFLIRLNIRRSNLMCKVYTFLCQFAKNHLVPWSGPFVKQNNKIRGNYMLFSCFFSNVHNSRLPNYQKKNV